jgi:tetratricopeptide (TPR) repeat protein
MSFQFFVWLLMLSTKSVYSQPAFELKKADSLYQDKKWELAKQYYAKYVGDDSSNSMFWNRLGYCNQNLGNLAEAIRNYQKVFALHPSPLVKSSAEFRLAMVYSMLNKNPESADWLMKASYSGYNGLNELDSLPAFAGLRAGPGYPELRKKIYGLLFPCSQDPRNRAFDFWIGDWNCYRNGTQILSGYSHIESIAGECAILENYTSVQGYTGKSFNFYDTIRGKWEQDWIGSGGASDRQRFYNGEFRDGAMRFTYEMDNPGGEKIKGNFIFYNISRDSVRQYQDVTNEQGKTISVTYDLMYLRRKN